ncbi:hypothetical protein P175DRAFT_0497264 [Aspergillus ochraceoroseus IBT 24754]|uniref:Uncharacterized protein n=1 Tax=Aspergillus ochraceoroseus IBT 24754 TaxID=1392256 RepID=A0A2T5M6I5_9EURO|nr:uncharacterized protein P175DRAFT_0497264 [Aspergillus ochraceoroseus IBT 24754]PTU24144.1 hypothetical protein P175DRAFT_0497264 [Aspergillus ochraceoroseus IBT 24754]
MNTGNKTNGTSARWCLVYYGVGFLSFYVSGITLNPPNGGRDAQWGRLAQPASQSFPFRAPVYWLFAALPVHCTT